MIQVKTGLQSVVSANLISCSTGSDCIWSVCTVFRECIPLAQWKSVGYTDKVPHSLHWTTNFYLTTVELILEGSSPKLHPFRHGELLKASTKESNPTSLLFHVTLRDSSEPAFVASSIVRLIECLAIIFIIFFPSLCCDWMHFFFSSPASSLSANVVHQGLVCTRRVVRCSVLV